MLSPDLVRRVTPPIWTIPATRPDVASIHFPTDACGFNADAVRSGKPREYMEKVGVGVISTVSLRVLE